MPLKNLSSLKLNDMPISLEVLKMKKCGDVIMWYHYTLCKIMNGLLATDGNAQSIGKLMFQIRENNTKTATDDKMQYKYQICLLFVGILSVKHFKQVGKKLLTPMISNKRTGTIWLGIFEKKYLAYFCYSSILGSFWLEYIPQIGKQLAIGTY